MAPIQHLCLLRLSAIGDVCHAVALLTRIRRTQPQIRVTWIIGKIEYQLVKHIAKVEFIIFDKSQGRAAYTQLQQALAGREFDALLAMQVAFRANWAVRLIKAKRKIGFDWARSKEGHYLVTNERIAAQPHAHVLDGFMGFADQLGIPESPLAWDLPIPEADQRWAENTLKDLGRYVVFNPAASKAERNWLPERYAEVIDWLTARGIKTVLTGGPGKLDTQIAAAIAAHTQKISLNLVGKTSLIQLLAVLKNAAAVLAPDTGPAHMATLVGTPVIGLYAHSNPRRTGPYADIDTVVSVYDEVIQQQKGKPWTQLPWGTRAKGEDLMARIAVAPVLEQLALALAIKD